MHALQDELSERLHASYLALRERAASAGQLDLMLHQVAPVTSHSIGERTVVMLQSSWWPSKREKGERDGKEKPGFRRFMGGGWRVMQARS